MAKIDVDTTLWPVVRVVLPPSATDDELATYLAELAAIRARREPYALIVDANLSKGFTAKQRQMQATYIKEGLALSRRYLKAFAFVADSPWQRGMLTAILWTSGMEWPNRVFSTLAEAKEWARSLAMQPDA